MRQLITDYYQCSDEPKLVNLAVKQAWSRERKYSLDFMDGNEGEGTSIWSQIKWVTSDTVLVCAYIMLMCFIHFNGKFCECVCVCVLCLKF